RPLRPNRLSRFERVEELARAHLAGSPTGDGIGAEAARATASRAALPQRDWDLLTRTSAVTAVATRSTCSVVICGNIGSDRMRPAARSATGSGPCFRSANAGCWWHGTE